MAVINVKCFHRNITQIAAIVYSGSLSVKLAGLLAAFCGWDVSSLKLSPLPNISSGFSDYLPVILCYYVDNCLERGTA